MSRASELLAQALSRRAAAQRRQQGVYQNQRPVGGLRPAQWLSDTGFLLHTGFDYTPASTAHYYPNDPTSPREVRRIIFVAYGGGRDYARLTSSSARDSRVHSARAAGRTGLARWPLADEFVGAADVADTTAVAAKTAAVLTALRDVSSGPAYHAVIARSGTVTITAPLDGIVLAHPQGKDAICVAVEAAFVRPRAGGTPIEAPFTLPQLVSLAAYVAKVRTAYPTIPLTIGDEDTAGLSYVFLQNEGFLMNSRKNLQETPTGALSYQDITAEAFLTRIRAEPEYRLSSDIFRPSPPPENARTQAQSVIGHTDTAGQESLELGAYMDLASADRSDQAQQAGRAALFVRRARHSAQEADASAAQAGTVAQAPQLEAPPVTMTGSEAWTYNYSTGRWGAEDPAHSGGTV